MKTIIMTIPLYYLILLLLFLSCFVYLRDYYLRKQKQIA